MAASVFTAVSGRQASEAHVLQLQVLVDAVLGAFGTQPGLLDPAERRLCGGHDPLVDSDHPDLHRLGNTPDLTHVLGEEVACGQTCMLVTAGQTLEGLKVNVDSPARPELEALARARASSSLSNLRRKPSAWLKTSEQLTLSHMTPPTNRTMGTSGPKVSSFMHSMWAVTSVSSVGSTNDPCRRLPPFSSFAP